MSRGQHVNSVQSPGLERVRAAAERVAASYREGVLLVPEEGPLREDLHAVVAALEATLEGSEPLPPRGLVADPLRLLAALRSEVLRDWPDDLPLLPTMRAFEAVQEQVLRDREAPERSDILPTPRSLLREVAHMLRSPLGSIVLLADTLRGPGAGLSEERRNKQLGIIHNAALGLAGSAGDLLALIDEEDGLGPRRAYTPAEIVDRVADIVRPVADVRGSELVVAAPEGPERVGPATALTRVLISVALRVVRRTRDGRVDLSAAMSDDGGMRFSARGESGPHAEEGAEEGLFEIFRLDDPVERSYTLSGEGLGLVTAARILRAMGSELGVYAEAAGSLELSFTLDAASRGGASR